MRTTRFQRGRLPVGLMGLPWGFKGILGPRCSKGPSTVRPWVPVQVPFPPSLAYGDTWSLKRYMVQATYPARAGVGQAGEPCVPGSSCR